MAVIRSAGYMAMLNTFIMWPAQLLVQSLLITYLLDYEVIAPKYVTNFKLCMCAYSLPWTQACMHNFCKKLKVYVAIAIVNFRKIIY